jgi:hypothetical protein
MNSSQADSCVNCLKTSDVSETHSISILRESDHFPWGCRLSFLNNWHSYQPEKSSYELTKCNTQINCKYPIYIATEFSTVSAAIPYLLLNILHSQVKLYFLVIWHKLQFCKLQFSSHNTNVHLLPYNLHQYFVLCNQHSSAAVLFISFSLQHYYLLCPISCLNNSLE